MLPRRPSTSPQSFRLVHGWNAPAELEALVGIGRGRFEDGVHAVARVFGSVALKPTAFGHLFGDADERAQWVEAVYEDDARVMGMLPCGVSAAVSLLLTVAWPRLPEAARVRATERIDALPRGMGQAWLASGQTRRWAAPPRPGGQTTFDTWDD